MSTTPSGPPAEKKISSCVRPGVCEVRASALRLVSALMRLDLPTLERPANAISTPCIDGSEASEEAAATNCQSPLNSVSGARALIGARACSGKVLAGFPNRTCAEQHPAD